MTKLKYLLVCLVITSTACLPQRRNDGSYDPDLFLQHLGKWIPDNRGQYQQGSGGVSSGQPSRNVVTSSRGSFSSAKTSKSIQVTAQPKTPPSVNVIPNFSSSTSSRIINTGNKNTIPAVASPVTKPPFLLSNNILPPFEDDDDVVVVGKSAPAPAIKPPSTNLALPFEDDTPSVVTIKPAVTSRPVVRKTVSTVTTRARPTTTTTRARPTTTRARPTTTRARPTTTRARPTTTRTRSTTTVRTTTTRAPVTTARRVPSTTTRAQPTTFTTSRRTNPTTTRAPPTTRKTSVQVIPSTNELSLPTPAPLSPTVVVLGNTGSRSPIPIRPPNVVVPTVPSVNKQSSFASTFNTITNNGKGVSNVKSVSTFQSSVAAPKAVSSFSSLPAPTPARPFDSTGRSSFATTAISSPSQRSFNVSPAQSVTGFSGVQPRFDQSPRGFTSAPKPNFPSVPSRTVSPPTVTPITTINVVAQTLPSPEPVPVIQSNVGDFMSIQAAIRPTVVATNQASINSVGFVNGIGGFAQPGPSAGKPKVLRQENEIGQDGYHYVYETENRILAEEEGRIINKGQADQAIQAKGFFEYVGPDGNTYRVDYVADENGFQPTGDHLPKAPPVPEQIQRALDYIKLKNQQLPDQL